jgi:SpoVK/Ycf46/Vps4 family AAA+-type ATPase
LLAGPPGTGKTLTAAALAGELKYPLFTALLHGLITKFMGETAQKLRMVFDAVRTTRGVYLFDEIDALAAARGAENDVGEARRILNSFLQVLDEDTGPSIVVATTNLPQILDRAILRRFDLVLPYEMPAGPAIEKAMRRRLGGFDVREVKWSEVANNAAGLSTADVVAAAEDAARRSVLGKLSEIETSAVIASLERRRSLHGIRAYVNAEGSPTLHIKRSGAGRKIKAKGGGSTKRPNDVPNRAQHAQALLQALDALPNITGDARPGLYLEVQGRPGEVMITNGLNASDLTLLAVEPGHPEDNQPPKATVFASGQGLDKLRHKIEDFARKNRAKKDGSEGRPYNADLVQSIGAIVEAGLRALWRSPDAKFPDGDGVTPWEIWLDKSQAEAFIARAAEFDVAIGTDRLEFPEDLVVIATATRDALALAVRRLAGIRALAAPTVTADYFDAMEIEEQAEWLGTLRGSDDVRSNR